MVGPGELRGWARAKPAELDAMFSWCGTWWETAVIRHLMHVGLLSPYCPHNPGHAIKECAAAAAWTYALRAGRVQRPVHSVGTAPHVSRPHSHT